MHISQFYVIATVFGEAAAVSFLEFAKSLKIRGSGGGGVGGGGGGLLRRQDDPHSWIPASQIPGASRSPCPLLNTAANHGFLPRDGRNISIEVFNQAIQDTIGFDFNFANAITIGMLSRLGVITNTSADSDLRLDLGQTNAHGKTEHDASIARPDESETSSLDVSQKLVDELMDDSTPKDSSDLDAVAFGRMRVRRERESQGIGNPPLTDFFETASLNEAGLILLIMGDDVTATDNNSDSRTANKKRVQTFLGEEKFPYEYGFQKPSRVVQITELGPLHSSVAKFQAMYNGADNPRLYSRSNLLVH